jgi:SAM-dependent methyltransferase
LQRAYYGLCACLAHAWKVFSDWMMRRLVRIKGSPKYPPGHLRLRVNGAWELKGFVAVGKSCLEDLEKTLQIRGLRLDGFRSILDFGCGCGRASIPLLVRYPGIRISGTDTDREAIAWCAKNVSKGNFEANEPLPPLVYSADSFDFVFSISVLTHLDEDFQFRWLEELRRITAPGGYVLLTLHGKKAQSLAGLSEEQRSNLEKHGHLFCTSPNKLDESLPDWYQNTFHSEAYVRDKFSNYFNILEYIPAGMNDHQDVVLLQKTE